MTAQAARPLVGVAAIIRSTSPDGSLQILFGKRKGSHGAGTWAPPGGHLDFGESIHACAEREALEETGLQVAARRVLAVTNDIMGHKHYVTLHVLCDMKDAAAEPQIVEPEKCEGWTWKRWADIAECAKNGSGFPGFGDGKLFDPILNLIVEYPRIGDTLMG